MNELGRTKRHWLHYIDYWIYSLRRVSSGRACVSLHNSAMWVANEPRNSPKFSCPKIMEDRLLCIRDHRVLTCAYSRSITAVLLSEEQICNFYQAGGRNTWRYLPTNVSFFGNPLCVIKVMKRVWLILSAKRDYNNISTTHFWCQNL